MTLDKQESIEYQIDCLYPCSEEDINYAIDKEPFFNWIKENAKDLTDPMIRGLASNLIPLKAVGKDYMYRLIQSLKENGNNTIAKKLIKSLTTCSAKPVSYEVITQLGYTGPERKGTPVNSVLVQVEKIKYRNRGLTLDKGKIYLNANIFAKYVLTRINVVNVFDVLLYIYDKDGFFVEITRDYLKKLCRNILHEANDNIWKRTWENEYFEALMREIPYVKKMNQNAKYINLKNGMLNLYTKRIESHDPKFLSTIQIPINYNPRAKCPNFDNFLFDIFEGDSERIRLIQELLGYCFIQDLKVQKVFIFLGHGSNGKSVLAEIIRQLIGVQNTSNTALSDLTERFGMQNLPGKLVNISTENEVKKISTEILKKVTVGDAVDVEKKYKDSFSTVLFAKIILLMNRMMDTDDTSDGYYRRLQIIPFNKEYTELKVGDIPQEGVSYMDKTLTEKLLKELDGILKFALDGLQRLITNDYNLTRCSASEKALEKYIITQNPIIEFFKTHVKKAPDSQIKRPEIKKTFTLWAKENGFDEAATMGATRFWEIFNRQLVKHNISIHKKRIKGEIYLKGIKID